MALQNILNISYIHMWEYKTSCRISDSDSVIYLYSDLTQISSIRISAEIKILEAGRNLIQIYVLKFLIEKLWIGFQRLE